MSKKCNSCGFQQNPDNAHYCGIIIWSLWPKSCSSDNKIARIEINGKYGIGYNEDKMLVPATYDSISANGTGNQWIIYDKNKGTLGLAYVTDSVTKLVEPSEVKALQIERNANGLAILQVKDSLSAANVWRVARNGVFENTAIYKRVVYPGPIWGENACLVASHSEGGMQILGIDGKPINGKTYFNIEIDPDSMIRAIDYDKKDTKQKIGNTTIHDYSGKQTTSKTFYTVEPFSDGVAWSIEDKGNRNTYSVIDRNGNVLFRKPNTKRRYLYNEGIAWISTSSFSDKFIAIDKSGNELFKITAEEVFPFSMGLAAVNIGTYAKKVIGFVDKTGNVRIPYKYSVKSYAKPTFKSDSMVRGVTLNGVKGKLHRNGTFIPNK